jgi:hypothetical protein
VAPGTHPDRTEMRFTRFPRGEHQPSPPSARRVSVAKRAVQAEKDRYPLFPKLVRYATTEKPPGCHARAPVPRGGNSTVIMSPLAGGNPELPSDRYRLALAPGSSATGKPARYPVTLFTSLVCCTITGPENAVSSTPWPNCADSN